MTATIALVALTVPTTSGATPYIHEPGSKSIGIEAQREQPGYQDLRSPDAKDAGQAAAGPTAPQIVQAPGFDWGDATIGAGAALGLMLILISAMFAVVHRRGRRVEGPGGPTVST